MEKLCQMTCIVHKPHLNLRRYENKFSRYRHYYFCRVLHTELGTVYLKMKLRKAFPEMGRLFLYPNI